MSTRRPSRHQSPVSTDWPDCIRQAGLRSTTLTVAVLELLDRLGHPCSHDELAQHLATESAPDRVDRVTLYRILDRLTAAGLLTRIQGSDRVWRHVIAQPRSTSGYFECDQCHTISALPDDPDLTAVLERLERRLSYSGVQSTASALTIHGTCRDCSHQGNSANSTGNAS
jgi:Fur family ferric uptake transcriptional regulator